MPNKKNETDDQTPIATDVPTNVRTDALGKPIDVPNEREPKDKKVYLIDHASQATIWVSEYIPMPVHEGIQITLDIYVDGQRIHHLFYVERIDTDKRHVHVKLNKVYVNDNPIIPTS